MLTTGVDLSSQPARTAACTIGWANGRAEVTELLPTKVDDTTILSLVSASDKIGLDVPLGWPDAFVAAVAAHSHGRPWPGGSLHELCFRDTDRHVASETGRWPLSVSSDRIAIPGFRAAGLLAQLPFTADRSGAGKVVEVYPAAALRRWGLVAQGYKGRDGIDIRVALVADFKERTSEWLYLTDDQWHLCELGDDALDAVIAAIVTKAFVGGQCDELPAEKLSIAQREGWIALPLTGSLHRLA